MPLLGWRRRIAYPLDRTPAAALVFEQDEVVFEAVGTQYKIVAVRLQVEDDACCLVDASSNALEAQFDLPGAEIVDADGNVIGQVSSGGFGPSLGAPVAMGYVKASHMAIDSEVWAVVRGKRVAMKVAKTPFVPQRYYRG